MKVGILTYHDTTNYGAALQAYASQAALNSMGVDAEIIDYTNEFRSKIYSIRNRLRRQIRNGELATALKTLLGAAIIHKRKKRFAVFFAGRLKCSTNSYRSDNDLRTNCPYYDYYLVGSDQVWNEYNNGGDLNYLLDFVHNKKRTLSYASSFGATHISNDRKSDYARLLGSMQAISVREGTGADLVLQLTGRRPPVVLDPVFLLDQCVWNQIADNARVSRHPFILIYVTTTNFVNEFLRSTKYEFRGRRLAIVTSNVQLRDVFNLTSRLYVATSPDVFLALIRNADLILTSSFHGTALSVIMEKQFVSFLKDDKGRDSRIVDMLASLGLSDRIYSPAMTARMVEQKINYHNVNTKLALLRNQSGRFLREALHLDV